MEKPPPFHLYELKLNSCKSHNLIVQELVKNVVEKAECLQSLSLVGMNINLPALQGVVSIVRGSIWLENLDISWNKLAPNDFSDFFSALQHNKNLRTLHMSHNLLVPEAEQKERGELAAVFFDKSSKFKAVRDWFESRAKEQKSKKGETLTQKISRCLG